MMYGKKDITERIIETILFSLVCVIGIFFSIMFLLIIEGITPLENLVFFPQFFIFGLFYIVVLPVILLFIANLYLLILRRKYWDNWFKISDEYNGVLHIIALFPFLFLVIEVPIFLIHYGFNFNFNSILMGVIYIIPFTIIYILLKIIMFKIFRV